MDVLFEAEDYIVFPRRRFSNLVAVPLLTLEKMFVDTVPQAGLELAHECKLAGLGEALHEGEEGPGQELRAPVDNAPQVVDVLAGDVGGGLLALGSGPGPPR